MVSNVRIKVITIKELSFEAEEELMNKILAEMSEKNLEVIRIEYRTFSNVIEYRVR